MRIKRLLKKQSSAVMPNQNVKERIKADCGIRGESSVTVGGTSAVKVKRRVGISVAAVCAAAAVALTTALILIKPAAPFSPLPDVFEFGTVSSATDFYAYGAVSVGNMLDYSENTAVASTFSAYVRADAPEETEVTEGQKLVLDKYAVFATGILGDGKITSSYAAADKEGYEYKLGIGYTDGFGGDAEKTLYFNKVEGTIKREEDEEEFAIVGELVTGNISYPVEGKYETEADGGETENEIEFTAFTSSDRRSYIKIEHEYESEAEGTEIEYVISVYDNGKLIEKAEIKGETGEETSYEVDVVRTDEDDVKIKFTPAEHYGKNVMEVDADFGGREHKLIMRPRPKEEGGGHHFTPRDNGGNPDRDDDKDDD